MIRLQERASENSTGGGFVINGQKEIEHADCEDGLSLYKPSLDPVALHAIGYYSLHVRRRGED